VRERLIFKLGVFVGLRPGEIFALRRNRITANTANIQDQKSIRTVVKFGVTRERIQIEAKALREMLFDVQLELP
jgi:hypothetical protein